MDKRMPVIFSLRISVLFSLVKGALTFSECSNIIVSTLVAIIRDF